MNSSSVISPGGHRELSVLDRTVVASRSPMPTLLSRRKKRKIELRRANL
jgi:hypothetical protein